MSSKLRLCVTAIIMLGITYFIYSINVASIKDTRSLIIFVILSIIAESLLIPTPGQSAVSVGFAIGLAAVIVLGVPDAAWIASLGIMLRTVNVNGKRYHILNYPLYKTLFNGSNILISAGAAGYFYRLLGGESGVFNISNLFLPLTVCILVYVLVNETIISWLMSSITDEPFNISWFSNLLFAARDCIFVAPIGVLMALAYMRYDILGIFLFLGPLLLARYSYKLYMDMRNVYFDTVKSLSQAMEAKDPYTKGHSMRVSEYAHQLGSYVKLPQKKLDNLTMAAILHDIGKIGIDESILNKPGRLTEEEYDKIKQHPEIGVRIIQDIKFLKEVSEIIMDHHEKMDGTGYPNGKKLSEISTEAAILGIADVYDALTSNRPYRGAMTVEQALSIIEQDKGKHLHPRLVDDFIKMIMEQRGETH
jgi:putative nucleotidyltransferase with HDIG domain